MFFRRSARLFASSARFTPNFARTAGLVGAGLGGVAISMAASKMDLFADEPATRTDKASGDAASRTAKTSHISGASSNPKYISMNVLDYKVLEVETLSPTATRVRFALPNPNQEFNLPVCSTLRAVIRPQDFSAAVSRLYTPITPNGTKGYFDIVFRDHGGYASEVMRRLKPGDTMKFQRVPCSVTFAPQRWKHAVMIAGGVGITPVLQIINEALHVGEEGSEGECHPPELTLPKDFRMTLIYANRTREDALLYDYFQKLQESFPDRFQFVPIFSRETNPEVPGFRGHVNEQLIRSVIPPLSAEPSVHYFVCGGDKFVQTVAGVPQFATKDWSSGRASQPFRFEPWPGGSVDCVLTRAGFLPSQITVF